MFKQTGPCIFNKKGHIIKGTIVRHSMLPGLEDDTKNILDYLSNTYHDNIYISIMNQYTPPTKIKYPELRKTINKKTYEKIIDYALSLGINNAFCQMEGTQSDSFIPQFNLEGVKKRH